MSRSGVQSLKTFFLKFPAFSYNAKRPAEKEFCRLWDTHGWEKSSTEFKTIRRQFLKALVKETDSPVHKFFVNQYEKFDYDSGASPRKEFDRLQRFEGWNQFSPPCARAKGLFEEAFKEDFNSKVDIFFRKFEDFDYNPRASPKLEFRRLKLRRGWGEGRRGHGVRGGYERIEKEKAYVKARNEFFRAFGDELDAHFGTDGDGIKTWESLCKALGVDYEPAPTSISQCQKASISSISFYWLTMVALKRNLS
ncbi:hypothetical protein Q9L58_008368 [Maublancomyces gigas]|uniref:Uncharacterized protein n=1 Tax=Discina gigas TaxID=1032678 RepID=A0ABR3G9W0_9PEZI